MHQSRLGFLVAAVATALSAGALPARAENPQVTFSLPTTSLSFGYAYVADKLGFWKEAGLDLKLTTIAGLASTNALLGGSVEFGAASGPTVLTAWARGQKPVIIASTQQELTLELVVSKELAQQSGLTAKSSVEDRARALKGKTIAVDGVNSIIHGYLKYVLEKAGLDPERDVTVTPMAPSAMTSSLMSKRIDAFVMGSPWTTQAEREGAVMWISAPRGDLDEMKPLTMTVVMARSGYCEANTAVCKAFLKGVVRGATYIHDQPAKAMELLQPLFKTMDPALMKAAFDEAERSLANNLATTDAAMAHAQDFALIAGQLKPADKRSSFQGLYTNAYLP
jgi:ABC-type nitrate/sulfonate/bicarbonate transport system substrate-binding protein